MLAAQTASKCAKEKINTKERQRNRDRKSERKTKTAGEKYVSSKGTCTDDIESK